MSGASSDGQRTLRAVVQFFAAQGSGRAEIVSVRIACGMLVVAAWGCSRSSAPTVIALAPASTVSVPVDVAHLPQWSRPLPSPPAGLRVTIGPDHLRVDGAVIALLPARALRNHGLDVTYKSSPNSLLISPLTMALRTSHPTEAVLAVDPGTSYRIVTEVVFTAAQAGVSGFHFLAVYETRSGPAVGSVDVYPPARGPTGHPVPAQTAPLSIRLKPDGVVVQASSMPDCGGAGRVDGQLPYDFAALTRCGAAAKRADGLSDDLLLYARGRLKNTQAASDRNCSIFSNTLSICVPTCCEGVPWTSRRNNGRSWRRSCPRRSGARTARVDRRPTSGWSSTGSSGF